jgi:hypothetical protein
LRFPAKASTQRLYSVDDPDYPIIRPERIRHTHYYFYIRDEVLGPLSLRVGSFLPFPITYYLNGPSLHRTRTAPP